MVKQGIRSRTERYIREPITKELVYTDMCEHRTNVKRLAISYLEEIIADINTHDHSKLDDIDGFFDFMTKKKKNLDTKNHPWILKHMNERHHVKDFKGQQSILGLGDIIHMFADWIVSATERTDYGQVDVTSDLDDIDWDYFARNTFRHLLNKVKQLPYRDLTSDK